MEYKLIFVVAPHKKYSAAASEWVPSVLSIAPLIRLTYNDHLIVHAMNGDHRTVGQLSKRHRSIVGDETLPLITQLKANQLDQTTHVPLNLAI